MTCVVVTRGGFGDFFRFENLEEADEHPLVQYGDAMLTGPGSIIRQYNLIDVWSMMLAAGLDELCVRVRESVDRVPTKDRVRVLEEQWSEVIWSALLDRVSREPPEDPATICEMVRRDRVETRKRAMTEQKTATGGDAAEKTETPKEPKKIAGHPLSATITMGVDKDGKKYGASNNPKREGTASHARFAKYKDGATIEQTLAIKDGPVAADISHDASKGFIKIG